MPSFAFSGAPESRIEELDILREVGEARVGLKPLTAKIAKENREVREEILEGFSLRPLRLFFASFAVKSFKPLPHSLPVEYPVLLSCFQEPH